MCGYMGSMISCFLLYFFFFFFLGGGGEGGDLRHCKKSDIPTKMELIQCRRLDRQLRFGNGGAFAAPSLNGP